MNRRPLAAIAAAVAVILLIAVAYLLTTLKETRHQNQLMLELAEMDKLEMQNEYEDFSRQYNEMMTQINNDSLMAQLEQEQQRTQALLEELERTKASDAAEITRLKRELANMRQVLKSFVAEIDSLNRLNERLSAENDDLRQQQARQQAQINTLAEERESLSDKVAIASQLDATGVRITSLNKRGKEARKIADVKRFQINFSIARNVTAATGNRTIYARLLKPTGDVLAARGTFAYEGRRLDYSVNRDVEYNGEETPVVLYIDVNEMLVAGTYRLQLFADGHNIGTATVAFDK